MDSTVAISLGGEAQSFPERGDQPNDLFGALLIWRFLVSFFICSLVLSSPWGSLT